MRSSSRSVRLRSVSTSNSLGKPCSRNMLRRTPQRPVAPGKASVSGASSFASRQTSRRSSRAVRPSNLSIGFFNKFSPARLTRRSLRSGSKVKTATSISAMIVRKSAVASNAPRRCRRKVSPSSLTSSNASPSASFSRAPLARIE